MKELEFTVSDVKDLMDAFSKNKLGRMQLKQGDFFIELEGHKTEQVLVSTTAPQFAAMPAQPDAEEETVSSGNIVKAPIVGTFYGTPAPDKPPYISVGSKVKKGDVLFIIESMKLMNEVTSDFDGTVKKILLENATPVEFGQPILIIE